MLKYIRQLASESIVYGLAGVISRFVSIFLVPVYARLFTPSEYGVMSLVTTTISLVSIFAVLALDNSAGRWFYDTEDELDQKKTISSWAWCQISVSIVLALMMFILSEPLSRALTGDSKAGIFFQISAGTLPLTVLVKVVGNWLRFQRRAWTTVAYAVSTNLLTILLTILFIVILNFGLTGVYLAQLASGVLATFGAIVLLKDWIDPSKFHFPRLLEMLRFGLPLIPASLAYWVVSLSGRYFIQVFEGTSEVGLYQVGTSIAGLVALITGAFQQAWGPFGMSIFKRPDAKSVYATVLLAYTWITCAISTGLALFSPEIIQVFATDTYLGASPIVGILAFNSVMIGLTYIANVGPTIVKTTVPIGLAMIIAAVINIALNFIMTPSFGMVGSAIATLISQTFVPVYLFYHSQRLYPIPYRFPPVIALFLLSFGLIGLANILHFNNLFVGILVKLSLLFIIFFPISIMLDIVKFVTIRKVWGQVISWFSLNLSGHMPR